MTYWLGTGIALPPLSDATLPTRPIARLRIPEAGCLLSGAYQIDDCELPRRVSPGLGDGEASAARQCGDTGIVVFVGVLGMHALALGKGEAAARDRDQLRLEA